MEDITPEERDLTDAEIAALDRLQLESMRIMNNMLWCNYASEVKCENGSSREDKALRKKLKKERQKDRKNVGKSEIKPKIQNSLNDARNNENVTMKKDGKGKSEPDSSDNEDDNTGNENSDNDDDNNAECKGIDFSASPAFVKSSIVGKKDTMKMLKKISVKDDDSVKDKSRAAKKIFPDETDGFTSVKKGTKQAPANFCKTPDGYGIQALCAIRIGNFSLAIDYLTRAIALDSADYRHHINRSYCHLRTGDYEKALADIRFAGERFSDVTERSRAKCREGQALCGLQNYGAAEQAFRECIKLTPNCPYAKRELRRMQIMYMVHMGFREREAIMALEKIPDTMLLEDAIILLTEEAPKNDDSYDSTGSATDDEIFESDSEEFPSNERLLSKILNYDPTIPDEVRIPELMSTKIKINTVKQPPRTASTERELRVIKTITAPVKPKSNNHSINEMAIWVGNLSPMITDNMLIKRFGKFGKVIQVWRSPSTTYAFVNFQSMGSARKALEEASSNGGHLDVDGNILPVKPATNKTLY